MIIRQAQMADLDAIYAIELENFSPEEAISREILAKHIETISSTTIFLISADQSLFYFLFALCFLMAKNRIRKPLINKIHNNINTCA